MASTFRIVYHRGNRSVLSVFEVCEGMEYELVDFDLASEQTFHSEEEAEDQARLFARQYGLQLHGIPQYLDSEPEL